MLAAENSEIHPQNELRNVLRFVRKMNGSAQSMLVQDDAERLWVLKPKSESQGPHASGNEYLGSILCRALGLPTPDFRLILLDKEFCCNPHVWLSGSSGRKSLQSGLHFASRYLPDLINGEVLEGILPCHAAAINNINAFLGMFLFDIWAMHADRRQVLLACKSTGLEPFFFDHSHLFGGPKGLTTKPFIDAHQVQKLGVMGYQQGQGAVIWIELMQNVLPVALDDALASVPSDWFVGGTSSMRSTLLRRLDYLRPLADLTVAVWESRITSMRGSM